MTTTKITRRDVENSWDCAVEQVHRFMLHLTQSYVLEVEDVHFHHNSPVLLPDSAAIEVDAPKKDTEHHDCVTGLAVLATAIEWAGENSEQKALIAGHADTSGQASYNFTISDQRADSTYWVLKGDDGQGPWVELAHAKHRVMDYKAILRWVDREWGWACDPGKVDDQVTPKSRAAVKTFHVRFNQEFGESIPETDKVTKDTWRAIFRLYQRTLAYLLRVKEAELDSKRDKLQYLRAKDPTVGCGESFPIEAPRRQEYRSSTNRRVEILFFDPAEIPALDCHPDGGKCNPKVCEIYEEKRFDFEPIPCTPGKLGKVKTVDVHLKLVWSDPAGKPRPFPEGVPVSVDFDGEPSEPLTTGPDGVIEFEVLRSRKSFRLSFSFDEATYFVSPPPDAAEGTPEQKATADEADELVAKGHRAFLVPGTWSLANTRWKVEGTSSYDTDARAFTALKQPGTTIGSTGNPAVMTLDPHWQYVKFLYVDRILLKRLSIPPVMLEGFADAAAATGNPANRSNWCTSPEASQCLPWIIDDPPKPDEKILLRFTTPDHTFIETPAGGDAAKRTVRVLTDPERLTPGPERLHFYDLPKLWESRNWFARLSGGTGQPAAKRGLFETLAAEPTTDAKPLLFTLDDLVLAGADGRPLPWKRVNAWGPEDRVAVFWHGFAKDGTNTSDLGVYKPDPNAPYFTTNPDLDPVPAGATHLYLFDYPFWTRAVIAEGNVFDVFDRRLEDPAGPLVGARAAVRIVDARPAAKGGVGRAPGNQVNPRPGPVPDPRNALLGAPLPMTIVQPFFWHAHFPWHTPTSNSDRLIGRCDVALFRCTGLDKDREVAVSLQYFRLDFNFAPVIPATSSDKPSKLTTPAQQAKFAANWMKNVPGRWNGQDAYGAPTTLEPQDPAQKLTVRIRWFAQLLPTDWAQFQINVYEKARANMGSQKGDGKIEDGEAEPDANGKLTVAHEAGHGWGHGDEYNEVSSYFSYWQPSFHQYLPGSPYSSDLEGIMKGNLQTKRGRYFWHMAEWMNALHTQSFQVMQGATAYKIRSRAGIPEHTHVNWPIKEQSNARQNGTHATNAGRGRFDLFLYPLGAEIFSMSILRKAKTFNATLSVSVKMRFEFDSESYDKIHDFLEAVQKSLKLHFRDNLAVKSTSTDADLNSCWFEINPRYLVTTFSDNADYLGRLSEASNPFRNHAAYMAATGTNKKTAYTQMANISLGLEPAHYFVKVHDKWYWPWEDVDIHWDWAKNPPELFFEYDKKEEFWKHFSLMLGFKYGEEPSTTNIAGIASFLNGGKAVAI